MCPSCSPNLAKRVNAQLHVYDSRGGGCEGRRVSYERGEARQRRPRARHVVHDDLAPVEAHYRAALWLRVRVAGVVAHRPLPLPGLPQRVVYVRVVINKRMGLRTHTLVFAFGILNWEKIYKFEYRIYFAFHRNLILFEIV